MRPNRTLVQKTATHVDSLPAPVGGWNARDAYANMDPLDAITLTNLFPTPSNVTLRGGSTTYATGMVGQVQSVIVYNGANTSKMFAFDAIGTFGPSAYDVTAGGNVGAFPVLTFLGNALWESANIATSGGNYLYAVNGLDKPELYNGATWTAIDAASVPAITGVTTTTLNNVLLFKNRLWFIQKNTLKAWYLPTSAIGGAAQVLDLSSIARMGGFLVDFDVWTTDAGYGLDDMLVFITSQGEVIIYRGTDPASAATWALVGVWSFGAPVTNRCMVKLGGDLLLNTLDGLYPLSASLVSDRLNPKDAISYKIQNAISLAASVYSSNPGWQIFTLPAENVLLLNVPIGFGQQQQYVMNTITRNWCNLTDWPANCWALLNDKAYFGANGTVVRAWDQTYSDDGNDIATVAQQAFNYFDKRGIVKYFTRARPAIYSNGFPATSVGVTVDFNTIFNGSPLTFSGTSFGVWDTSLWDSGIWGQDTIINSSWQGITGIGYCASLQFSSASSGVTVGWASTDIVFQTGWAGI